MLLHTVTWVGDFGTVTAIAEDVPVERAAEFARQQMMDWHGIDPAANGMVLESIVTEDTEMERKGTRCEDYPCCGHESGDCNGGLYDSDENIKNRIYNMSAEAFDDYLDRP